MLWLPILPAAIGIAAVFWLIRWVAYGTPSIRTPGDWAILALCGLLPITYWVSIQPNITRIQVYRLLSGIALYYAIANWSNRLSRLRILLIGTAFTTLLLALIAPFGVEWAATKLFFIPGFLYQRFVLLVTDTVHPNVLAGNLVILLAFPMAMVIFGWNELNWFERSLFTISSLAGLGIVVLTQSRGAWMAMGILISILVITRWRWGWLWIIILSGSALLLIWYVGITPVVDFLMSSQTFNSLDDRINLWVRGIFSLKDFPFTGIGMGLFTEITNLLYPSMKPDEIMSHAHNLFLQIAIDLGVPGVIAWLAIWFSVIAASWQMFRVGRLRQDRFTTGLGAALLGSHAALFVHGLLDSVTWGMVRPAPLVWAIWGISIAAWYTQIGKSLINKSIPE